MPRIEFNPGACSGCQICQQVCSLVKVGVLNIEKARIRIVTEFGKNYTRHIAHVCRQCEDPPCVAVCPTGALEKKDGRIIVHEEKCILCLNCKNACPFNAIFIHPELKAPLICDACGACTTYCPMGALKLIK